MDHTVPPRPNRFDIDLGAIAHNLAQVRRLVGPSVQIVAALKADAYGFGLGQVADTLAAAGADAVAVADLSDAVFLAERGLQLPVLLYAGNLLDRDVVRTVQQHRFMPTILDAGAARLCSSLASAPIGVFVKVDVGLERLGVTARDAVALVHLVASLPNLELRGLYTHVHVPGAPGAAAYIDWQLERFFAVCSELERDGVEVPVKMAASSAVLRHSTAAHLNAVDPGHLLFGLTPAGPANVDIELRRAFVAVKSRLIHARTIVRSEFRDLAPFPLRDGMRMGVIPMGLRDGMGSLCCGAVLVGGRRVAVLGGFSLEHTRIDLTEVPSAGIGDEVIIIGAQGEAAISPEEVAEHMGFAVAAQLPLAVGNSVARHYIE